MMNSDGDRLDQIETLLERFIDASIADRQASNERMTRLEQMIERDREASNERMTRLEQMIERDREASNERATRLEQMIERDREASNERATRFEQGLEETRQLVHSNNRFLESFSQDLRKYTESMNNLATRNDGIIATANQDRQETNSRLAVIERIVRAIAKHLGVTQ